MRAQNWVQQWIHLRPPHQNSWGLSHAFQEAAVPIHPHNGQALAPAVSSTPGSCWKTVGDERGCLLGSKCITYGSTQSTFATAGMRHVVIDEGIIHGCSIGVHTASDSVHVIDTFRRPMHACRAEH